jgi:hypothetical protein
MRTYTTLDGSVLDLTALAPAEWSYFDECVAAYRAGMDFAEFSNHLLNGEGSPLIRATGGWVTRTVWAHPLFQAVSDLADRLGIAQGQLGTESGIDPATDPLVDEWVPAVEAARRKGVALSGLHQAVQRGDLIAHLVRDGGKRLVVSANSLARWKPQAVRQAAGRQRAAVASRSRVQGHTGRLPAPTGRT